MGISPMFTFILKKAQSQRVYHIRKIPLTVNFLFHHIKEIIYELSIIYNIMYSTLFPSIYREEAKRVKDIMSALNE